jgi:hypothetical protein
MNGQAGDAGVCPPARDHFVYRESPEPEVGCLQPVFNRIKSRLFRKRKYLGTGVLMKEHAGNAV